MSTAFLTSHVTIAIAAIYAVLIVATLIVAAIARRKPAPDLVARITSWWWMITLFAFAILTWQWLATLLLAFVSFLALKEYFSLIPQRRDDRAILFWAYLAIPIEYALAYTGRFGLFMTFVPIWMFCSCPRA